MAIVAAVYPLLHVILKDVEPTCFVRIGYYKLSSEHWQPVSILLPVLLINDGLFQQASAYSRFWNDRIASEFYFPPTPNLRKQFANDRSRNS